jgi:hypothetical protein
MKECHVHFMVKSKACKISRGKLQHGEQSLGVEGRIIYDTLPFKYVNWIQLAHDMVQKRITVIKVMDIWAP